MLELLALDTHEEDSLNGTVEGMIAAIESKDERRGRWHPLAFRNRMPGIMRSGTRGSVFE
jgi:hypothetical protein